MPAETFRRGLLAVAAVAALAMLVIDDQAVSSVLYIVVAAVSLVVGALGLGRVVRWRSWWTLLLAGLFAWLVADTFHLLSSGLPLANDASPDYLPGAVLVLAALVVLGRARQAFERAGIVVGVMFVAGWGLVGWHVVTASALSTSAPLVVGAYCVTSAALGAVIVTLLRSSASSLGERMVAVGVGLSVVGNMVFAVGSGSIRPEKSLWLIAYALVGLAPWYASHERQAGAFGRRWPLWRDALLMAIASVAGPLTMVVLGSTQQSPDVLVIALSQLAVVGLLLARVQCLLAETTNQAHQVARLADTDALTGLPNARRFAAVLERTLAAEQGEPLRPTVLLVGLTDFADLNERLGHRAGDELVRAAAERITSTIPEATIVAHMGAEVFGVLLRGQSGDRSMARAQRLAEALRNPLELQQLSIAVRPVIGLATADGGDAAELISNADLALAAARGANGPLVRFSTDLERRDALSAQLVGELGDAITRGEVVVYFQPQVELATGRVTGAEALVRWMHPALGLLAPAAFVPAAEATGTIRVITLHVLDQALYWCARWSRAGRPLNVAVNLSARDLMHSRLVDDVREALLRYGLAASRLELEITETMAMADVELSHRVLTDLARLGVTISVDDYGTGYGSLAYLQQLPVRRLKIDRSFVSRMLDDEASTAIVRSTIELAGELGMDTVAEGVEDDATAQRLREFGCSTVQGFGLAAPMSPEGFERAIWRLEHRGRVARPVSAAPVIPGTSPLGAVAAYPSVARAARQIADVTQRPAQVAPERAGSQNAGETIPIPSPIGLAPVEPVVGAAADQPVPTRRALRRAAQAPVPHRSAGSVGGLRAAATSERTTGVDPA